jgi:hypothetical protein
MLYVPVSFSDDSDGFPFPDVNDPQAVASYWFSPNFMGAQSVASTVDGRVRELGPDYAVGTPAPGLPTGGHNCTVMAAFLSPMSKGTHTVTIAATFNGALFGGQTVRSGLKPRAPGAVPCSRRKRAGASPDSPAFGANAQGPPVSTTAGGPSRYAAFGDTVT